MRFWYFGPHDMIAHFHASDPVPVFAADHSMWVGLDIELSMGDALEFEMASGLFLIPHAAQFR